MIRFSSDFYDNFLAVVRKYMQLRGGLAQKDLSEMTGIGISTMSRFFSMKTSTIDPQVVANIVATLSIPLHEIIDGVEVDSTDTFKRLVLFYKEQKSTETKPVEEEPTPRKTTASINVGGRRQTVPFGESTGSSTRTSTSLTLSEKFESLPPRQRDYLVDFLNLEVADRDLIIDLGDAIFRYFRKRNSEL